MSNEEIVAMIQDGRTDLLAELWERIERLVKWKAVRVIASLNDCYDCYPVEFDDLYQSGYFAMVEAIENYNPDAGMFSTWFMYYLKTAFAETSGIRTQKQRQDPMRSAVRLETPINEEKSDSTLLDFIPDPAGELGFVNTEDQIYQRQLHDALEAVLNRLPVNQQIVIRKRYYEGCSIAQLAEESDVTTEAVRQTEREGLRNMRMPRNQKLLRPFWEHDITYGRYSGLGAFRSSGMSDQERYLIRKETAEKYEET